MEWSTLQTEYEGLPLYLRKPNYKNIYEYKTKYPELICITHEFDNVKDNGLPTSEYNKSLIDFDNEVVNIFQEKNNGIIFLVETYGGARNYWFFGENSESISSLFNDLKNKYSKNKLELDSQNHSDWTFLEEYPVPLYKKI
ncbi:uncharacterized protein DUF695 [Flavobacterium cutihirudinis]|uniref:Uncharacterized protein DUF695 n=1 Tax=Flavobacterium cutihirudinis TaxID=1265740 RepID=A0A3D9FQH5_9FLAO|nr:DUF695 domain-containing protein [Flavobacterium cutihirudinis]RED21968.1 uncharacterized protein DUF695 [Flavobacterium cutihirudinis]